jgi:hypothetical protein
LGGTLPVYTLVTLIAPLLPCSGFVAQWRNGWHPPSKAWAGEGPQGNVGHLEPAAVLGVWCIASLVRSSRAFAGGKASESEPIPGVLRFAHPRRPLAASGERTSSRSLISLAQSTAVLGAVTRTGRGPLRGSVHMKMCAVPCRSYASSPFSGFPGAAGRGCLVSVRRGTGCSSIQTRGPCGWEGRWSSASTSSLCATHAPLCAGGIPQPWRQCGVNAFFFAST